MFSRFWAPSRSRADSKENSRSPRLTCSLREEEAADLAARADAGHSPGVGTGDHRRRVGGIRPCAGRFPGLARSARATARLLYDDRYLYLACDVKDHSPWKNGGSDLSTLFKTGDTIDLWLGPSAGKRDVSTGDVRVLFAPQESGTVAVAFRPKVIKNPVARSLPFAFRRGVDGQG